MICRWINKNIDLDKLAQAIENFFKEKGVKARIEKKSPHEILVYALIEKQQKRKILTAKISGEKKDFSIEFPLESRHFRIFGNLLSLMGGGVLFLKEIENKEILGNIEEKFWEYLEKIVENHI
ncbi:MAG: hypothetical protein ACPLW8_02035 [Candidatus Bathyarchaeales archaeon]